MCPTFHTHEVEVNLSRIGTLFARLAVASLIVLGSRGRGIRDYVPLTDYTIVILLERGFNDLMLLPIQHWIMYHRFRAAERKSLSVFRGLGLLS